MYKYYIVEHNKMIPITNKSQVKVGSIVAISDGKNTVFYKIDKILPKENIANWIKPPNSIASLYVLKNDYLSKYFTNNSDLEGFFHSIGHFFHHTFHEIGHGVSHAAHEVGHGVSHVVHEVKKHPVLLAIPAAAAAYYAIPAISGATTASEVAAAGSMPDTALAASSVAAHSAGIIPAIGHAISSAASYTGHIVSSAVSSAGHIVGSAVPVVAKATVGAVASNIAGSLISRPPSSIISDGANDLGLPQNQAQQIMQETNQYAQQNNVPQSLPYQQTAAYVAAHWDYFAEHGFKSPEAAVTYILMKRHGVPPRPNDDPSTVIGASMVSDLEKYLPYMAIAVIGILLLIPPEKRTRPNIIFLGGK